VAAPSFAIEVALLLDALGRAFHASHRRGSRAHEGKSSKHRFRASASSFQNERSGFLRFR